MSLLYPGVFVGEIVPMQNPIIISLLKVDSSTEFAERCVFQNGMEVMPNKINHCNAPPYLKPTYHSADDFPVISASMGLIGAFKRRRRKFSVFWIF